MIPARAGPSRARVAHGRREGTARGSAQRLTPNARAPSEQAQAGVETIQTRTGAGRTHLRTPPARAASIWSARQRCDHDRHARCRRSADSRPSSRSTARSAGSDRDEQVFEAAVGEPQSTLGQRVGEHAAEAAASSSCSPPAQRFDLLAQADGLGEAPAFQIRRVRPEGIEVDQRRWQLVGCSPCSDGSAPISRLLWGASARRARSPARGCAASGPAPARLALRSEDRWWRAEELDGHGRARGRDR